MDFTGKICPYCKTEFKEGDDIVVCSVCEMPHHKECWMENKACTTFGCTGTISGADQHTEAIINKTFCTKCGAPLNDGQKFCASCGNPAESTGEPHFQVAGAYSQAPNYQQNTYTPPQPQYTPQYSAPQYSAPQYNTGYSPYGQTQQQVDPDLYAFLQTNQPVYISKFQKMQITNSKVSWNWCSFLFGAGWFAYRKMYGIAAACAGISIFAGLIPGLGSMIQLALWICAGIFGNHFYKQYVDGELQIAKRMDDYSKSAHFAKKGGTSVGAVFALFGILFVIGFILGSMGMM